VDHLRCQDISGRRCLKMILQMTEREITDALSGTLAVAIDNVDFRVSVANPVLRGDVNLAWPTARIAVMGVEGAVSIIFRDQLERAEDRGAEVKRLTGEYEARFANPYIAAGRGYVDDVIEPSQTRPRVIAAFRMLEGKRDRNPSRKHGNIPL